MPIGFAVCIVVFVAMIVGYAFLVFKTDHQRAQREEIDTEWIDSPAAAVDSAVRFVDAATAERFARLAMSRVGGAGVIVKEDCVAGWVGNATTNIPQRQQYELVVRFRFTPDGVCHFLCASRPRFSSSLFGFQRSQELANKLALVILSAP